MYKRPEVIDGLGSSVSKVYILPNIPDVGHTNIRTANYIFEDFRELYRLA